jgi:hypothetical protein
VSFDTRLSGFPVLTGPAATVYLTVATRKASADSGAMTAIMSAVGGTRIPAGSADRLEGSKQVKSRWL